MNEQISLKSLKRELLLLCQYILKLKQELAAISKPSSDGHRFDTMAEQLDAIVEATEGATETILGAVEEIGQMTERLRARVADKQATQLVERIDERVNAIFEACTFQDITGQRVTKIVRSVKFVDERVNAMAALWGADTLAEAAPPEPAADEDEGATPLQGPALKGEGVTQADIDKLFD
jgi:chemotaxis protein CheZ